MACSVKPECLAPMRSRSCLRRSLKSADGASSRATYPPSAAAASIRRAVVRREDAVGRDSAGRETRRGLFGCDSAYDLQIKEEVREVHTEHRQRGAHRIAAVQYTRKMLALTDRVHLTARYEAE
eukprot:7386585-Prymnesium_polylepis.1